MRYGRAVLAATLPWPPQRSSRATGLRSCGFCSPSLASPCTCQPVRNSGPVDIPSMLMRTGILPVKGVKAITYIATCHDKQVVLSVLCSLLNTVRDGVISLLLMLIHVDSKVQSRNMARAVRPRSLQRPEADTGHILPTAPACAHLVPHPRTGQRSSAQEFLPPFPRPATSPTRLSIPRRWHDAYLEPACMCHACASLHCLTFTSYKQTPRICQAVRSH
jgi:hypothetical protein